MKCLRKSDIAKWLDGELGDNPLVTEHLDSCASCRSELESAKRVIDLVRASAYSFEPSDSFESGFWQKVNASIKEPWYRSFLEGMEGLVPRLAFSPVLTVLMAAMLVGGSGGILTGLRSMDNQETGISLRHVTGYSDYKGLPASSVAAAYLQWSERKSS